MGKVIEVVYENGVFKPLKEVNLKEGEKLRIEIKESLVDKLRKYRMKVDTDILQEFLEERR
ncbi:antitoxin family protein [Archaeoglobus sp.]